MSEVIDQNILLSAMDVQFHQWKKMTEAGCKRVGWKIGFNVLADQQRMKLLSPVIGFLTDKTVLSSGGRYKASDSSKVMLEAEVAIRIQRDVEAGATKEQLKDAIEGFAAAIEIVDVAKTEHDIASILEGNVFHERVIFGELKQNCPELTANQIKASVSVNQQLGLQGDPERYPDDFTDVLRVVSDTLHQQGETLKAGDWIIAGSITIPVQVKAGDQVDVNMEPLGKLTVTIE